MQIIRNDRLYHINVESVGVNVIAFACLIASIFDGYNPAFAGIGLFILDAIRNPYPNILDVTEEMEDEISTDDDDINPA